MQRGENHDETSYVYGNLDSKSFKEAFIGEKLGHNQKGSGKQFIRFLYVESYTKEWLGWSAVGRCRS